MHVWQGGEGAQGRGRTRGRGDRRHPGPLAQCAPRTVARAARAPGAGLGADSRGAGGGTPGGRGRGAGWEEPARPLPLLRSTPASAAPPRDSDSRAARAAPAHRDGRTAAAPAKEDAGTAAPRPSAGGVRVRRRAEVSGFARRAPAPAVRVAVSSVPPLPKRVPGSRGSRRVAVRRQRRKAMSGAVARRPAVRAPQSAGGGRVAPSAAGKRRGAAVAIQGLREAAMQREEAGGGREGGGESQRRASQRAGAAPPGWHRGRERSGARGWKGTSAGACGPGLGGASRPGQGGPIGSHRWFLPEVYRTFVGKAREHFGFLRLLAPATHSVLSWKLEKGWKVWDPASRGAAQGLGGGPSPRWRPCGTLMLLSTWEVKGNGRTHAVAPCLERVKLRLTCRLHWATLGLFLGTARVSAPGVRISRSFESELSPAAVLLCYSGWLSDFIRRRTGRNQRKTKQRQLSFPLKSAAELGTQA